MKSSCGVTIEIELETSEYYSHLSIFCNINLEVFFHTLLEVTDSLVR